MHSGYEVVSLSSTIFVNKKKEKKYSDSAIGLVLNLYLYWSNLEFIQWPSALLL